MYNLYITITQQGDGNERKKEKKLSNTIDSHTSYVWVHLGKKGKKKNDEELFFISRPQRNTKERKTDRERGRNKKQTKLQERFLNCIFSFMFPFLFPFFFNISGSPSLQFPPLFIHNIIFSIFLSFHNFSLFCFLSIVFLEFLSFSFVKNL